MSQPLPVSHLPVSHREETEMPVTASVPMTLTDDEYALVMRMRAAGREAAADAAEVAIGEKSNGNVTPLRRRTAKGSA